MTADIPFLLEKARKYCDFQERCFQDVEQRLRLWQVQPELIKKIILQLEKENYLDEDRYVRNFALGKMRNNKWGRNKILYALRTKNIPELVIQSGLMEIDTKEYTDVLKRVLKSKNITESNASLKKFKLAQYAIQKGFQPTLVWELLNKEEDL